MVQEKKMPTCGRKGRKTGKGGKEEGEGGMERMYCKAGGAKCKRWVNIGKG